MRQVNSPQVSFTEDECAICMNTNQSEWSILQPCNHSFCSVCARTILAIKLECPLCRGVPCRQVHVGSGGGFFSPTTIPILVRCTFQPCKHAGITLTNTKYGVRVVSAKARDVAYISGIRRNDVIVSINGLPCASHAQVVRVWDAIAKLATDTKMRSASHHKTNVLPSMMMCAIPWIRMRQSKIRWGCSVSSPMTSFCFARINFRRTLSGNLPLRQERKEIEFSEHDSFKCLLVKRMTACTITEMRDFEKFVLQKHQLRLEWAGKTTIVLVDRKDNIKYEFGLQRGVKTKVTSRVADKSADVSRFMQLVRFHISQRDPNRTVRATDVVTHRESQCRRNKCFSHLMRAFPNEWVEFNGGSSIATTAPITPLFEPATNTMPLKLIEKMIDDNARMSAEQRQRNERQQFYESEKNAILQMLATRFKGVDLSTYKESLQHLRELARYILDSDQRRSLSHAEIVRELLDHNSFGPPPYPSSPGMVPNVVVQKEPIVIKVPEFEIQRINEQVVLPQVNVERPEEDVVLPQVNVRRPEEDVVLPRVRVDRPEEDVVLPRVRVDRPEEDVVLPQVNVQRRDEHVVLPRVRVDRPDEHVVLPRVRVDRPEEDVVLPGPPRPQPSIQCRIDTINFMQGQYPEANAAVVVISHLPNTRFRIELCNVRNEAVSSEMGITTENENHNVDIKQNLNRLDPGSYTIFVQAGNVTVHEECPFRVTPRAQSPPPEPRIEYEAVPSFERGDYPAASAASVTFSNLANLDFTIQFRRESREVMSPMRGRTTSAVHTVPITNILNELNQGRYTILVQISDMTQEFSIEVLQRAQRTTPTRPLNPIGNATLPPTRFTFITLDDDDRVTRINKENNLEQIKHYCERVKNLIDSFVEWLKTEPVADDFVKIFLTFQRYNATFNEDNGTSIYAYQQDLHLDEFDPRWLSNLTHTQTLRAYLAPMGYQLVKEDLDTLITSCKQIPSHERMRTLKLFLQGKERVLRNIYNRLPEDLTEIKNGLREVPRELCERPDSYAFVNTCILPFIGMVKNTLSMENRLRGLLPGIFEEVKQITPDLVNDEFNWISFVNNYTTLDSHYLDHTREYTDLNRPRYFVRIPS